MSTLSSTYNFLEGELLLIDKPLKWTSFDVVNKIRYAIKKHLNIKKIKVGHAGTLDPLATGLLLICTGKYTKKISEFQALNKCYTGTITIGSTTPSFDLETEVDNTFDVSSISQDDLAKAVKSLTGEFLQIPPSFSAKKVGGRKAYDLARKGTQLALKPTLVNVSRFDYSANNMPNLDFNISCTKGTYIRSIARDLGAALDNGAHLSSLRRISIGEHQVENAFSIEDFVAQL